MDTTTKVMKVWQFLSPNGRTTLIDVDQTSDEDIMRISDTSWDMLTDSERKDIERNFMYFPGIYDSLSQQEDWKEFFRD